MTSGTGRAGRSRRAALGALSAAVLAWGCASAVEVTIETPLQSKLDVSAFRRVLLAGFVTEPGQGELDVDVGAETVRLLQNQLRSASRLQVLEPDRPPLHDRLEGALEALGPGGKYTSEERERYRLEGEKLLQDAEYWRSLGEEYQTPLIVTGKVGFEVQSRSGFQSEERVVREPATGRPRLVRGSRYQERKAFTLSAEFHFVDGRTGETLHKEKFTEEVLYGEEQQTTALSSYFELMDRLLPNFLGVISPQKIRGTRLLLP